MRKKNRIQLFAEKAAKYSTAIGEPRGEVVLDNQTGLHSQLFERGIILERIDTPSKETDLICCHGMIFNVWWGNKDAEWLGRPLEDLFETTNFKWDPDKKEQIDGDSIMVQRFERGVIWCRSDGSAGAQWLSWRDWNAISEPGNKSNRHR